MRNSDRPPEPAPEPAPAPEPDRRSATEPSPAPEPAPEPDYTVAVSPRQLAGGFAILAALLVWFLRRRWRRKHSGTGEAG